jgi:diaminopimelate epimerase
MRFVHDQQLTPKREIVVETQCGLISPRLEQDGRVTVDMGAPVFEPSRIPFVGGSGMVSEALEVAGETLDISALSMGNPHAVQVVEDIEHAPVRESGPLIEQHPRFPKRVNAGFMQVMDRHSLRLRVYERGAGETLSCGTGACAAVVAGICRGLLDSPVNVATRGGVLTIAWAGNGQPVLMTGPAITVFAGEINL